MITIRDLTSLPIFVYGDGNKKVPGALSPFVWTEVFLKTINQEPNQLILHIWPMTRTVILGMLDRQLPYFELAKTEIGNNGYVPVTRNIGGLAVVADDGILNFSLVIPDHFSESISISNAYLIMVDVIRESFSDYYQRIEYHEIKNSYCPGNF